MNMKVQLLSLSIQTAEFQFMAVRWFDSKYYTAVEYEQLAIWGMDEIY